MNIHESWEKALSLTQIVRPRVRPLETFAATHLPYIFLASAPGDSGKTILRKGEVVVEKPAILMPFNLPSFEGFHFEDQMQINEDFLKNFFLVRGISFPSLKYNNKTASVESCEGSLSRAIEHHMTLLQRDENVQAGLITGSDDCWQFSILIFVCEQAARSAGNDLKKLFENPGFRREDRLS